MSTLEQARWFSEQVQPHEPALRAYLSKRFPALPDHDDLVQETYVRTLRAHEGGRVPCARAFLFTTARNAAIDLFRRRRGHAHEELSEFSALPLLDEAPGLAEAAEREAAEREGGGGGGDPTQGDAPPPAQRAANRSFSRSLPSFRVMQTCPPNVVG